MINDKILEIATKYYYNAGKLHDNTNQMYGEFPYSYHIKSVAREAINNIDKFYPEISEQDAQVIMFGAAYHDSIEDARLTYNDVLKIAKETMTDEYAIKATEIVYALTNEKGRNRQERANDKYYEGIRNTEFAPFVKMCDRLANAHFSKSQGSRMYELYKKEHPHFQEMIGIEFEI